MIRYSLICKKKHDFEAWFRDSADFDAQADKGLVSCPNCGTSSVSKALMAPNVGVKSNKKSSAGPSRHDAMLPAEPPASPVAALAPELSARQQEMLKVMTQIRDEVLSKSEDVGSRFPEEARKIHYQEEKPRGIHGKATAEEAEELQEEGVEFYPLPVLPEDQN